MSWQLETLTLRCLLCVIQAWSGLGAVTSLKERIAFNYQCHKRGKAFYSSSSDCENKSRYEEKKKRVDHFSIFSIVHKASLYNLSMAVFLLTPKPTKVLSSLPFQMCLYEVLAEKLIFFFLLKLTKMHESVHPKEKQWPSRCSAVFRHGGF